jgi:hypothetical protein
MDSRAQVGIYYLLLYDLFSDVSGCGQVKTWERHEQIELHARGISGPINL